MNKAEHVAILPECIDEFHGVRAEIRDMKENHLVHIHDKIEGNTKWIKWGIGLIGAIVTVAFTALGLLIALFT